MVKNSGEEYGCGSRDTNRLDSGDINSMLAKAIINSPGLEFDITLFNDESHANECVFSYSNTNWYGIYLVENDNKYYLRRTPSGKTKEYHKLWFQVDFTKEKIIKSSIRTTLPKELQGVRQCVISENGSCVEETVSRKGKEVELPKSVEEKLTDVVLMTPNPPTLKPGVKVDREFLENIKDKNILIDWMTTNMDQTDIMSCIGIEASTSKANVPTRPDGSYFDEIMNLAGNYGLREKYLNTVLEYCTDLTDVELKEDSGEMWVYSESIGWLNRNNFMKWALISFKGTWIPGKFLNAVKTWCPNIPGLRTEVDKGEKFLRSDYKWNDGWISKRTINDCIEDDTMPGYDFGKKRQINKNTSRFKKKSGMRSGNTNTRNKRY